MRLFLLIVAVSLLFGSCVNWKAKWYQSQAELKDCQKAPADTVIIIEPGSITYEPGSEIVVGEDTLMVQDGPWIPGQPALNFAKTFIYKTEKDSVKLWLLVTNNILDNELRQSIKIQRVDYPREIRTITKTVTVERQIPNRVNPNIKMIVIGVIILVGGLLALKIINLVTK